jgi:hypothetical protein
MTVTKKRTSAYQFTFAFGDEEGAKQLAELRATITNFNKCKLTEYKFKQFLRVQYRVCVKARLGKGNPKASNYKNRGIFSVLLGDASRYDVYVQTRSAF